jgi:hypothetical protein
MPGRQPLLRVLHTILTNEHIFFKNFLPTTTDAGRISFITSKPVDLPTLIQNDQQHRQICGIGVLIKPLSMRISLLGNKLERQHFVCAGRVLECSLDKFQRYLTLPSANQRQFFC